MPGIFEAQNLSEQGQNRPKRRNESGLWNCCESRSERPHKGPVGTLAYT